MRCCPPQSASADFANYSRRIYSLAQNTAIFPKTPPLKRAKGVRLLTAQMVGFVGAGRRARPFFAARYELKNRPIIPPKH